MAVPKAREILLPLFKILRENGTLSGREATNLVALRLNLTEDDLNEVGKAGKSNKFMTNTSFANSSLKNEGISETSEIGNWSISQKGKEISVDEFCELFDIQDQNVKRKNGKEYFHSNNKKLELQLKDFWSWNQSDILGNALRGILAEYIVATAIGAKNEIRVEWDAYDLVTEDGIKVEVKSSAYLQSWKQEKLSNINFSIAPTKYWNSETNEYDTETKRQADVYVFCLLNHKDRATVDPLNLDQWEFYIVSTKQLNEEKGEQQRISLTPLLKMGPIITDYNGLKEAISSCIKK